ncbi:MAG: Asp-tRNA(Asn)/Glu-tRNA(Gln) amidotransferase subunit GatB [Fuerstiella sp.]|nr:Asp-tRNA(Asn)/Glu-tRNA(Gln) amidotransferase subunit GatB [Fuerstiella sp.]
MSSPSYTVIIGLEVHTQLKTKSKLFCGCANEFNPDRPNTQTCAVCLGLPGALPVMNRHAFDLSLKTALALKCNIPHFTKWDRKQYYYPDLPKAYQISQFDLPFSEHGWLEITNDEEGGPVRRINITRAHLEEDAGKNVHDESGRGGDSGVDLNRTGTPLLEIVSEPDLRSASEARRYLEEMRTLLLFIGVSDCNMQEGSLRCDANVNLHIHNDDGSTTATPIVELKNMNSFRNVEMAIDYEVKRQHREFQKTGKTIDDSSKVTRGWDAERSITFAQREKEDVSDYRFFPDPDLVPVVLTESEIEAVRETLPETPAVKRDRFQNQFGLTEYDASVIIGQGPEINAYFEAVESACGDGKIAANWVTQDVLRDLNASECGVDDFPITSEILGTLLKWITSDRLTNKSAREVYGALKKKAESGDMISVTDVETLAAEREIVRDTGALETAITAAIASRPDAVEDVKAGKLQAVGPMMGMVMKQVGGADPKEVREMLIRMIQES